MFKKMVIFLLLMQLTSARENSLPKLEEINKKADISFLSWKVKSADSPLSNELRKMLSSRKALNFLVDVSQVPLATQFSDKELRAKINSISDRFLKRFNPQKRVKINKAELYDVIKDILAPEITFQPKKNGTDPLEMAYAELLDTLKMQRTPVGTNLEEWALRFLTSESVVVALQVIDKLRIDNKSFHEISGHDKLQVLHVAIDIVTKRFLNNLHAVRQKFNFSLPNRIDEALREQIETFLKQKFIQ